MRYGFSVTLEIGCVYNENRCLQRTSMRTPSEEDIAHWPGRGIAAKFHSYDPTILD